MWLVSGTFPNSCYTKLTQFLIMSRLCASWILLPVLFQIGDNSFSSIFPSLIYSFLIIYPLFMYIVSLKTGFRFFAFFEKSSTHTNPLIIPMNLSSSSYIYCCHFNCTWYLPLLVSYIAMLLFTWFYCYLSALKI